MQGVQRPNTSGWTSMDRQSLVGVANHTKNSHQYKGLCRMLCAALGPLSWPSPLQHELLNHHFLLLSWVSPLSFMVWVGCLPSASLYFITWCSRVGCGGQFVGDLSLNLLGSLSTVLVTEQKDTMALSWNIFFKILLVKTEEWTADFYCYFRSESWI